jgi:hypothetical protein
VVKVVVELMLLTRVAVVVEEQLLITVSLMGIVSPIL